GALRRLPRFDLDQRPPPGAAGQCRARWAIRPGLEVGTMAAKGVEVRAAFADAMTLVCALLGAVIGLALMLSSRDPAMAFHGFVFVVGGALAAIYVLKISFEAAGPGQGDGEFMDGPHQVGHRGRALLGYCRLSGR